ncbi:MAG: Crp/Fnr family transcriptional regulator, partial [Holophagales bacterium]|nr:Crp/Fnr family transcriptional regulator [Holophagales bacterium]
LVEALAEHDRFARLSIHSLTTLVGAGTPRHLPAGETILEEGRESPSVFILVRGRLKMTRCLANGRTALLALLNPGDAIGISVLGGRQSEVTVTAIEGSVCLDIPRLELLTVMAKDLGLLGDLLAVFTESAAECRNCLIESTFSRVEPRLAMLFLKLGKTIGRQHGGGLFLPVPLSRQDLADTAGTSIETAIRIMSRWSKAGIVGTREDGFLLRDLEALELISAG